MVLSESTPKERIGGCLVSAHLPASRTCTSGLSLFTCPMIFALTLTMTLLEFSEDFPGGSPSDALAAEIKHQPRKTLWDCRACVVCD